jgi:hypothetical protein
LKTLIFLVAFFCVFICFGQDTLKQIEAIRIVEPPKIDGQLDDVSWQNAPQATGFTESSPAPGTPSSQQTFVKILYDNSAIYIGAFMHDTAPDSILKELSTRDRGNVNADFFEVYFDTFDDDQNGFAFAVTSSGVQSDAKLSSNRHDRSWDAVWYSSAKIMDQGWVVEIKIPYSSLRFPKAEIQTWGVNFQRSIRRIREHSYWSEIDPEVNGFVNQFGKLTGISKIEPPLRLSITPYISGFFENYHDKEADPKNTNTRSFRGGLDVKYGINESFTLDMTIIPDFGQVQSDNQVLNLTPFEIRYQENRPFFTEGTALFNRAGIFYSRRIGQTPTGFGDVFDQLEDGETVTDNPNESQLINAFKITGRTPGGSGIGLFNAVTKNTYATIEDSLGGEREVLTEPVVNYNIVVFDQTLKNNSYISFINSNVWRTGSFNDANVTGTQFAISNKKNNYRVNGSAKLSQVFDINESPSLGYAYNVGFGKTNGNFTFNISHNVESDTYDHNDLGFLFNNNEISNWLNIDYSIYDPFWKLVNAGASGGMSYSSLYKPLEFTNFGIRAGSYGTFKNFMTIFFNFNASPVKGYDFFEARIPGQVYVEYPNANGSFHFSSDYRKRFAIDVGLSYGKTRKINRQDYRYSIEPRVRVSDKLTLIYGYSYFKNHNDIGFASFDDNSESVFGQRDFKNMTNTINATFIFTNKMSLSLRGRHNWTRVVYNDYYGLDEDGFLTNSNYGDTLEVRNETLNQNFNAFNIDLVYTWEFSPASELSFVWKNAILRNDAAVDDNFFDNFSNTLRSPQSNSFSLKVLYYLDYSMLKLKKKRQG